MSPYKPLKVCKVPGCPNLVQRGEKRGYCEAHKSLRFTQPDRERLTVLYDRKWQRRRKMHLAREPWCADCLAEGIYTPAEEVHHEIRHRGDPVIFRTSPLLSLCKKHHSVRTRAEQIQDRQGGS